MSLSGEQLEFCHTLYMLELINALGHSAHWVFIDEHRTREL